jgi:hypothetical protein
MLCHYSTYFIPFPGRWTEEEDDVLISAVGTYGTHWFQVEKRSLP